LRYFKPKKVGGEIKKGEKMVEVRGLLLIQKSDKLTEVAL
jgi:hypothetical protein